MQHACSHYNAFGNITSQTCTYLRTWQHQMTTIMQPFHCDLQPQIQDTHRTTHRNNHSLQNTEEEHIRGWNDRSRNRRTHEVPFIAGWSHFTRKNKIGFVLRLPPGHKPHATFMQPLQCVSQHHVANLHVSMSMHITRWQQSCSRFTATCNHRFKTRIELRTQDQPLVAEHRGGTQSRMKRPQPQPPHAGGTFHRRPKALYTEKHKVSCSGFLPNTSPMQQSCSHYNVFRSITSQTCTYLRTWQHEMTTIMQPFHCDLQPQIQDTHANTHRNNHLLQNTEEEHIRGWNDRSRNRRTHEVPFIAACSHFTRKNIRFRAPASSPTQGPCNIHAAITKSPLPKVATSQSHTSQSHHTPFVTTSLRHHFP